MDTPRKPAQLKRLTFDLLRIIYLLKIVDNQITGLEGNPYWREQIKEQGHVVVNVARRCIRCLPISDPDAKAEMIQEFDSEQIDDISLLLDEVMLWPNVSDITAELEKIRTTPAPSPEPSTPHRFYDEDEARDFIHNC